MMASAGGSDRRRCILFVDDEPDVTTGIRLALRNTPYEIITANSPMQALELIEERQVDAVVSDEQMPELSGIELLARIRDRKPNIIRMMLTGNTNLETASAAINIAGVSRFLQKPCSASDILECLSQALDARAQSQQRDAGVAAVDVDLAMTRTRMVYQPIIDAQRRTLVGYEALLRCDLAGVESPLTLLEAAQAEGRLDALTYFLFELVARDLAQSTGGRPLTFVNLAPELLEAPWLFGPENPLAGEAERVVLEITERASLKETSNAHLSIAALKQSGFRIAVDDLGSGYAGLLSLALLEPDIVKIDRALIQDLGASSTRQKLVASVVGLCRELGMLALAEGVETREERDVLLDAKIDLFQGFFFGRPEKAWSGFRWD